jgi:hypothetical protein
MRFRWSDFRRPSKIGVPLVRRTVWRIETTAGQDSCGVRSVPHLGGTGGQDQGFGRLAQLSRIL